MLVTAAARPLAATIGRRVFARSFATVGSQIPNVELHSKLVECLDFFYLLFVLSTHIITAAHCVPIVLQITSTSREFSTRKNRSRPVPRQ